MSAIVERMAAHSFAGRLNITEGIDGLSIADDERAGIRAALRSVRPEDVTGAQVMALMSALGIAPLNQEFDPKLYAPEQFERCRRAIAAAIARGAE